MYQASSTTRYLLDVVPLTICHRFTLLPGCTWTWSTAGGISTLICSWIFPVTGTCSFLLAPKLWRPQGPRRYSLLRSYCMSVSVYVGSLRLFTPVCCALDVVPVIYARRSPQPLRLVNEHPSVSFQRSLYFCPRSPLLKD